MYVRWLIFAHLVTYIHMYGSMYCMKNDSDFISVSTFRPSSHRKDKSRMNAQSRRTTHAQLLKELGSLLPFPEKVVQQIDYNSILRLVLCYFRMKNLAIQDGNPSKAISMYLHLFTYVHAPATQTYMQCTYLHVWRKLS